MILTIREHVTTCPCSFLTTIFWGAKRNEVSSVTSRKNSCSISKMILVKAKGWLAGLYMEHICLSHPIPFHSSSCMSQPMGFSSKYNSIKVNKFMKIYVSCILDRTTNAKRDTKRLNLLTLLTLKFGGVHNSLSFWHSLSLTVIHGKCNACCSIPSHGAFPMDFHGNRQACWLAYSYRDSHRSRWSSGNAFASGAGGQRSKSRPGQIGNKRATNGSLTLLWL